MPKGNGQCLRCMFSYRKTNGKLYCERYHRYIGKGGTGMGCRSARYGTKLFEDEKQKGDV